MLKIILKILGIMFVLVVCMLLVVVLFSAVETKYKCEGQLTAFEVTSPKTVFMKLEEYRWWVGLWSDSDGSIKIEIPNESYEYFSNLEEVGDLIHIYDWDNKLIGVFSKLSYEFQIQLGNSFFEGTCEKNTNS